MNVVDVEGLKELLGRNPNMPLIDVLPFDAFRGQHVPGSQCIPLEGGSFVERVAEFAQDRELPLIVYCAAATCSEATIAARELEAAGFSAVYEFIGGVEEWRTAGLPMESG